VSGLAAEAVAVKGVEVCIDAVGVVVACVMVSVTAFPSQCGWGDWGDGKMSSIMVTMCNKDCSVSQSDWHFSVTVQTF
jgi:hypothetical protein